MTAIELRGMDMAEDQSQLVIRVADRNAFQERLGQIAVHPEVSISALDSPDGSLEAAFDLLLRVHRGEHTF